MASKSQLKASETKLEKSVTVLHINASTHKSQQDVHTPPDERKHQLTSTKSQHIVNILEPRDSNLQFGESKSGFSVPKFQRRGSKLRIASKSNPSTSESYGSEKRFHQSTNILQNTSGSAQDKNIDGVESGTTEFVTKQSSIKSLQRSLVENNFETLEEASRESLSHSQHLESLSISKSKERLYFSSFIIREKHRALETKINVNRMRNALPNYTLEEIRNLRLPLHEAVVINLEERGFYNSAAYLNQLLDYQDEMVLAAPRGSNIRSLPMLKNSKYEITVLSEGLKVAETHHRNNRLADECEAFLKLGIYFAFGVYEWWWLGDEILIRSIDVSSQYSSLEGKYEALSRYSYARFLVTMIKDYVAATQQLQITQALAFEKSWRCNTFFSESGTLYLQINELLFKCFYEKVKRLMAKSAYEQAVDVAVLAQTAAAIACIRISESKAWLLKGICEVQLNQLEAAVKSLLKAFNLQNCYGTVEGKCRVRVELVVVLLQLRRFDLALSILTDMKQEAIENNLPFYLSETYKYLGSYFLSVGEPGKAYPILKEALRVFHESKIRRKEVGEVRNLEAIAFGLHVFPKYVKILNNAVTKEPFDFEYLMMMVKWKDFREPFWDTIDIRSVSIENFIHKNLTNLHIKQSVTETRERHTKYYVRAKK